MSAKMDMMGGHHRRVAKVLMVRGAVVIDTRTETRH